MPDSAQATPPADSASPGGARPRNSLPRWRGFNLLEMFSAKSSGEFLEDDFAFLSDWGFDFVRLPLCYALWTDPVDVYRVKEEVLARIDRAVELGRKHGVHVCLNFHRAPGYCVNADREEPFNLWRDRRAQDAFCYHWQMFARRYAGVPPGELSFNLVNEPKNPTWEEMTRADHERVIRAGVAAVREIDPERLIIVDGLRWGRDPCPELADLAVAQSCRAYDPHSVSHHAAPWAAGGERREAPVWPNAKQGQQVWDRRSIEGLYEPWADIMRSGVGVHCGEGGAYSKTPHDVFLRWFRDCLEVLASHGIGWALWNFRGAFGVLDSDRSDVEYEDFRGHRLDRKLLELLREF